MGGWGGGEESLPLHYVGGGGGDRRLMFERQYLQDTVFTINYTEQVIRIKEKEQSKAVKVDLSRVVRELSSTPCAGYFACTLSTLTRWNKYGIKCDINCD